MAGLISEVRSRWFGSLYWRIGVSFVMFMCAVILAQSIMFSYMLARSSERPEFSPNNRATAVAADLGTALEADEELNLASYLSERYGREPWPLFAILKDGRVAGNSSRSLSPEIRRSAETVLAGPGTRNARDQPQLPGPVVTAPIQVGGELRGLVVLPPPRGVFFEIGRYLSLPGTLLLLGATVLAAIVIFGPARRRLAALEQAAERLGSGDLVARAPEEGRDEIARVAKAFNRMGAELAARDEALRTSDRLRRQMLADVSHELKTPLTAMRGYLETLQMPAAAKDPERHARYFQTVERETRPLERIVSDLLDLARYESGAGVLEVRLFAIRRVFEHVARRHEQEADSRGIVIRIDVAAGADQVVADPDRIEQVIENLVSNAVRHMPTGGSLELRAAEGHESVELAVVDSGPGIPAEHIPHLFDRFYKADPARAAGSGGSGLGLSIVKAIVERHGGSVSVSSEPGRTAFAVTLPQPARIDVDDQPESGADRLRPNALHSTSTNL
jgi:signal transduction histidine kinase